MILNRLLTTFTLIILACSLHAQHGKDDHEVQQRIVDMFEALSDRDEEALRAQCAEDVRFYEYGEVWPVDTLIALAITRNTAADFKRTNHFDFISTTVQGTAAWVTYNLKSDIVKSGKTSSIYWMETVILVRDEKKWKIKVLHSTRINKN